MASIAQSILSSLSNDQESEKERNQKIAEESIARKDVPDSKVLSTSNH